MVVVVGIVYSNPLNTSVAGKLLQNFPYLLLAMNVTARRLIAEITYISVAYRYSFFFKLGRQKINKARLN